MSAGIWAQFNDFVGAIEVVSYYTVAIILLSRYSKEYVQNQAVPKCTKI